MYSTFLIFQLLDFLIYSKAIDASGITDFGYVVTNPQIRSQSPEVYSIGDANVAIV
jgi:hypothetical protein